MGEVFYVQVIKSSPAVKKIMSYKKPTWYWRIIANNGQILAHSEIYSSKQKAILTAKKIISAELRLVNVKGSSCLKCE